jgi:hypothetical protein
MEFKNPNFKGQKRHLNFVEFWWARVLETGCLPDKKSRKLLYLAARFSSELILRSPNYFEFSAHLQRVYLHILPEYGCCITSLW